ncbi:MAG: HAMP domain-containing sensor histidine kinase [Hyphomicrobiaceae bacterium]|nr:HAMP domain-containing histidine kinase [Hyphomicrobiaceae bacterium]
MTSKSLRLRLLTAAAIAIAMALTLSGIVLSRLFSQHVEAREIAELRNHQNQITAALEISTDSVVQLNTLPADPRFAKPNGGLYWQIDLPDGTKYRSRSLWETELTLPVDDILDGVSHQHLIKGPNNQTLLAVERSLTVGPEIKPIQLRLTVAVDRKDLDTAVTDFRQVLMASLGILGLALILASLAQIQVGLRPLARLRVALQSVHSGDAERVTGEYVSEVQPLINDMNALLDRERQNNVRARERAADLAHGFKTPLAVLSAVARELQRDEQSKNDKLKHAAEINTQIDLMGRHVRSELARARTVGASTIRRTPVPLKPLIEKIVAALARISADRNLRWIIDVAPDTSFIGDENDVLELIGNLADNASKWAKAKVILRAHHDSKLLRIEIEDDGPGIPAGTEDEVLMRGRRLDETTDGTGLGLSIVAKIVAAYAGTITLIRKPAGGLIVALQFPR